MYDASDFALGVVQGQRIDKNSVTIYYESMTLVNAQIQYSTAKKELLAIVFSLENLGLNFKEVKS